MSPTLAPTDLRFSVVILAAGASTRMGQPKLLLPWNDTSVLGHLLNQWRTFRPQQIAVVIASGDKAIPRELERLHADDVFRLSNPHPDLGMFSSIKVGASWPGWSPAITHWVLSLGDQPQVRRQTFERLLVEGTRRPEWICQPARNGRPRHPVLVPLGHLRQLATAEEENLKQFLAARSQTRHVFESDDAGLDIDLDYPADLERAQELARTYSMGNA
jgi:molybdenum cofactor cytidylyltransferase